MPDFAFITGIARSGTNLLGRMLAQHPQFAVAMDPMLPVLKWFRSAAVNGTTPISPAAPLDDYYFFEERLERMEAVQRASMDTPFQGSWANLQKDLEERAIHECADLVPHLSRLNAGSYAGIWQNGLDLVAAKRGRGKPSWVGVKELWTIEFVPHFLRGWSTSKAVLIVRDPRAVIASMLKMGENDETQQAQVLSYVRHWRKTAAFALKLRAMPQAAGRFLVVRYEDLVGNPEPMARELCRFFGVDFNPAILDVSGFWDPSRGTTWQGNSSYAGTVSKIDAGLAERWREYLSEAQVSLIEYMCGADMRLFRYEPRGDAKAELPLPAFLGAYGARSSWRSDVGDSLQDLGLEVARRALLAERERPDQHLIRRCFLFEQAFDALKAGSAAC